MARKRKTKFTHKKRKRAKKTVKAAIPETVEAAVPVGPRFQANLPNWNDRDNEHSNPEDINSDNSKWLGTRYWPMEGRSVETEVGAIGKEQPGLCQCVSPASVECVKHHITERRTQLQTDLGPAFWSWKFDEMGEEEVSKLWSSEEQNTFESLVKSDPASQSTWFSELAMEKFPTKTKQSIVSYYFNVYVPKRISNQIMAGLEVVDSDNEATEEACESEETSNTSRSEGHASKNVKSNFLAGWR